MHTYISSCECAHTCTEKDYLIPIESLGNTVNYLTEAKIIKLVSLLSFSLLQLLPKVWTVTDVSVSFIHISQVYAF